MKLIFILPVCICILLSTVVSAEYYQYIGADGAVHYTDNLAGVPAAARSDVKRYSDEKSEALPPAPSQPTEAPSAIKGEDGNHEQPAAVATDKAEKAMGELDREKAGLDKTLNKLQAERKELEENPPGRGASVGELQTYDNRVYDLNRRIKAYETRRKAFQAKAKAYNAKIKK